MIKWMLKPLQFPVRISCNLVCLSAIIEGWILISDQPDHRHSERRQESRTQITQTKTG